MATGWHGLDAVIPLGRLMGERPAAVADLVSREERELAEMRCQRLASIDGVQSQNRNLMTSNAVPLCFQPEPRKLVIGDAVLTPNANLDMRRFRVQIQGAAIQHTWQINRLEFKLPQMELESTANSRRIWTRELLTMPPCELGRESLLDNRVMPNDRQVWEERCLLPRTDFQPSTARLPRLDTEFMPTAPAVCVKQIRMPENGYRAPQLIGHRVKVRFDLPALRY
jgi:hypothetical protein